MSNKDTSDHIVLKEENEKLKNEIERLRQENEKVHLIESELRTHQIELELQNEELKQTQYDLVISRKKYQKLYEEAPVGYILTDNDNIIRELNKKAAKLLRQSANNLLNKDLSTFVASEYQDEFYFHFKKVNEENRTSTSHIRFSIDDQLTIVRISSSLSSDSSGNNYINSTIEDITEKVKAEEQIKLSEELFKGAFDLSAIGMLLVSPKGKFLKVNKAFQDMLDYKEEELLELSFPDITHPDDFGATVDHTNMIKKDSSFFVEKRYRKRSGEYVWCQLSTSVIPDEKGDVRFFISNVQDLTERKENENKVQEYLTQLEDSENKLKELNASKDRFFSIIASDLRNSLNNFMMLTDEFSLGIKNLTLMQMQEKSKNMHETSQKLVKVLENLLDWARSQTGSLKYTPSEYDLYEFALNNILYFKEDAKSKKIIFKNHIPMDTIVKVDYKMIDTIFRNLLSNAIKFTLGGGNIDILMTENHNEYRVSVKDDGIGISEERQNKLFKIGEKIKNEPDFDQPGTGLGLILCKEFISLHKGAISIESKPGEGSAFSFTIPKDVGEITH